MGIKQLAKVIADNASNAIRESELSAYFGIITILKAINL